MPDDDGDGAGDHAGNRSVTVHAFPPEAQQNHGAEGSAEPGPGVAHQRKDKALGVGRDENCHKRHRNHHHAPEPDEFTVTGLGADKGAVEVFGEGGRAHQELAGKR